MENQLFNLKKIREITSPVGALQGKVNQIANLLNRFDSEMQKISDYSEKESFLNQITELARIFESINENLKNTFTNNITEFLNFNNNLISKYKTNLKNNIKILDLNEYDARVIGQTLIEKRIVSKIVTQISNTPSISKIQWLELVDALNQNTIFLNSANELRKSYLKIVKDRMDTELKKIPSDISSSIIEEFKKQFNTSHDLTYEKFLKSIESKLSEEELQAKNDMLTKSKQKQEFEDLKKKQEEQTETYESYLKLSEKEFERRRRKSKREKLVDVKDSESQKKFELSEEVTEKIEKFKMKFDKKSDENYLFREDIDEDPIKVIRERKEKKDKEYKKFKDHFESD
jgi:hypothetical protein